MSGSIVISASYDKQVRCWDAATGRTVCCFTFQDSQINAIHLVCQTHYLAVAGFNVIRLYDMSDVSCGNIIGSQVLQQQQQMVTAAPGGQTVVAPPPIFSLYETQGCINFTSLGSFPLLPRKNAVEERNLYHNNIVSTEDSSLSTCEHDKSVSFAFSHAAITLKPNEKDLGHAADSTRVILYATSEDGHIRFFDAKAPNTMCVLRDITTGAAITCSCLSPDSRFLLTGSQIGQVSVWHIPTIITSIVREQQQQRYQTTSAQGGTFTEVFSADSQENPERTAVIGKFGRRPVHEFALEGDYTSVRSVSIDPLVRWFVVATNQGKLHFFRFTHDISLCGTKSTQGVQSLKSWVCGESTEATLAAVPRAPHESANDEGNFSFFLPHHGGAELKNNSPFPQTIPREGISSSAFVADELSNCPKCSPDTDVATVHRSSRTANAQADSNARLGDFHGSSTVFGAAPLHQSEHHQHHNSNNRNIFSASNTPQKLASRNDRVNVTPQRRTPSPGPLSSSLAVIGRLQFSLQKEMEFEEFYTFRAHHKYILKISISPNGELLTTCCADYTVGRFIIPEIMRRRGSMVGGDTVQVLSPERNSSMICPEQQTCAFKLSLAPTFHNEINDDNHTKEAVSKVSDPLMCVDCASDVVRRSTGNPNTPSKVAEATDIAHGNASDAGPGLQSTQSQQHQLQSINEVGTEGVLLSSNAHDKNNQREAPLLTKGVGASIVNISPADEISHSTDFCDDSHHGGDMQLNNRKNENTIFPNTQVKKNGLDLYFKPLPPLVDHNRWVWDCVFSDCSQFLFTVSSDCHVRMWSNIASDKPQSTVFVGHTKPVTAVLLAYNL
ncbi:unnamed protein product [Phytomonas sp. EM1]|nr:unnamed protein product [Phytomonas sp. EM1]|eukprot:CCW64695.1 unnamed protein product [Phytomonas sp. isolate EM1]